MPPLVPPALETCRWPDPRRCPSQDPASSHAPGAEGTSRPCSACRRIAHAPPYTCSREGSKGLVARAMYMSCGAGAMSLAGPLGSITHSRTDPHAGPQHNSFLTRAQIYSYHGLHTGIYTHLP